MRKDRISQFSVKGGQIIFFITEILCLMVVISLIILYIFDKINLLLLIILFVVIVSICLTGLIKNNYIIFTDEYVEMKSSFGILKKRESWSTLQDIRKKMLSFDQGRASFSCECYCLIFSSYILNTKKVKEVDRLQHAIVLRTTEQSTEMLKKYLPEKWLPYLDQPAEK